MVFMEILQQLDGATIKTLVLAILAVWEIIARITPSEKDNTVIGLIRKVLSVVDFIIPNRSNQVEEDPISGEKKRLRIFWDKIFK